MKLEIIEELRFPNPWPWYTLVVDGQEVYGSWNQQLVEEMFNQVASEGKFVKTIKKILKSQEFPLPLDENTEEIKQQS